MEKYFSNCKSGVCELYRTDGGLIAASMTGYGCSDGVGCTGRDEEAFVVATKNQTYPYVVIASDRIEKRPANLFIVLQQIAHSVTAE